MHKLEYHIPGTDDSTSQLTVCYSRQLLWSYKSVLPGSRSYEVTVACCSCPSATTRVQLASVAALSNCNKA